MKKLNNKQKEKIVYVVAALIIVSIIIAVVCNLAAVKASAADDAVITVVNGSQNLTWEEVPNNEIVDPINDNPAGMIGEFDEMYYTTDPYIANGRLYIPDFIVSKEIATGGNETIQMGQINYHIIFIMRTTDSDGYNIITTRGWYKDLSNVSKYTQLQYIYLNNDYTLISYTVTDTEDRLENDYYLNMYFSFEGLNNTTEVAGYVIGYDLYETAKQAVDICDYYNEILNPPTNVVYGTEDIVKTVLSTHTNYQPQNLSVPWDKFYLGLICSAVIEDTRVSMLWNIVYDGEQYGHGELIILDEAYNPYTFEIDLKGAVTYGQIELDIENTSEFDVKYIAVSDNLYLLNEDIVAKSNAYNEAGDNETYNAGYADGYAAGIKKGSIGPFANAKMMVEFSILELETNIVTEGLMEFPFDVNAGGISFENVWYWYNNSEFNDPDYAVQAVNISIYLTKPLLWKNTLFYFGNDSNSATFLPLSVSVRNAGTSGNTLYTAALDQIGDYFYVTLDNVEYLSIEAIEFTVTNSDASYADIFVKNKLTLYSDINQVIVDEMSYNLGEEAGYTNGYDYGFSQGELQAQTVAFSEGKEVGFAEGKQVGYTEGYDQGLRDDFRFYDLFFSLFDAQLNTFKSVVSFEIFGINVAGFVLGLVTIGIVAFVIRKVW